MIETREFGDSHIAWIGIAGKCNRENAFSLSARFAHQRVTGAVRQRDIAEDDIERRLVVEQLETTFQTVCRENIVTPAREQPGQDVPSVRMILHHQNPHIGPLDSN